MGLSSTEQRKYTAELERHTAVLLEKLAARDRQVEALTHELATLRLCNATQHESGKMILRQRLIHV